MLRQLTEDDLQNVTGGAPVIGGGNLPGELSQNYGDGPLQQNGDVGPIVRLKRQIELPFRA